MSASITHAVAALLDSTALGEALDDVAFADLVDEVVANVVGAFEGVRATA